MASKKKTTKKKASSKAVKKPKTTSKKKVAAKKASSSKKVVKKTTKKKVAKKATTKSKKSFVANLVDKIAGKKTSKKSAVAKPKAATKKVAKKVAEKVSKEKVQTKASQPVTKDIAEITLEFTEKKVIAAEVLLTDAEGRVLCKYSGCDELGTVDGYCRYHYLLNWKRIQLKKKILSEGKLEKYIHELTAKYPDKYIEMLRNDLKSEKDFLSVVHELEIDDSDSGIADDEEDNYIEQEVQGVSGGSKRSSEDDY